MEGFMLLVSIVCVAFGIFQIALMFKLWSMCNNVRKMTRFFIYNTTEYEHSRSIKTLNGFSVNDIVINAETNQKFKIHSIQNNAVKPFICYEIKNDGSAGELKYFETSEIIIK